MIVALLESLISDWETNKLRTIYKVLIVTTIAIAVSIRVIYKDK